MKVLVASYKWWGGFPEYVVRSLHKSGVSVREEIMWDLRMNPWHRFLHGKWGRRLRSSPGRPLIELLNGLTFEASQRRLLKTAGAWRPDLILVLPEECVSAETVQELRRRTAGAAIAVWCTDDPFVKRHLPRALPYYDHVFSFDTFYIPRLKEVCTGQVHELPIGCDPDVYRPVRLTERERRAYGSDISFVGTWYPNRREMLEAIADLDLAIWGWGRNAPASSALRSKIRGGIISNEQANLVYNASRIVVNIHHEQVKNTVTRGFEAPAAGAFQLLDAKPDIERFFVPGEEIAVFRTPEELRALVLHYLADAGARAAIAKRARERVLAEHTYDRRISALLEATGLRKPSKAVPAPPPSP